MKTIFCPIRELSDALLSELNRVVAWMLGDWRFNTPHDFWSSGFDIHNLDQYHFTNLQYTSFEKEVNLDKAIFFMLYRPNLLKNIMEIIVHVFPDIHLISYTNFVHKPEKTFSYISEIIDAKIENTSLFYTILNGLANRFLLTNPIILNINKNTSCMMYIELQSVIDICKEFGNNDNFGGLLTINKNIHEYLPKIYQIVQKPLSLGIVMADFIRLTSEEKEQLQSFISQPKTLLKIFTAYDNAFELHYNLYRKMATKDKSFVQQVFKEDIAQERRTLRTFSKHASVKIEPKFV